MRALRRYCLAPLVMAAAFFSVVGIPTHVAAAAAAHPTATVIFRGCPAGTNWDNIHHVCD